jgi:hypothetical protein
MGSGQCPSCFTPHDRSSIHFRGDWVDPRANLDRCGKYCPQWGSNKPKILIIYHFTRLNYLYLSCKEQSSSNRLSTGQPRIWGYTVNRIFSSSTLSSPHLRPTQLPTERALGAPSPAEKQPWHEDDWSLPSRGMIKNVCSNISTPP